MNGVNFFLRMRDRVSRVARRVQGRLARLEQQAQRLRNRLGSLGGPLAQSLGAVSFGALAFQMVSIASDATEMQNRFDKLFTNGEDSRIKAVEAELKALGERTKRGQVDLKTYTSSFQSLGKGLGFTFDEATRLSTELTGLGLDLSSFYNVIGGDQAAMEKLRSGLMGNHEALQAFDVFINDSILGERLTKMFGVGTSAASEQQKAMARLAIVTERTQEAQNDAAETAKEYANTLRGVQSRGKDLAADFGKLLIPMFTRGLNVVERAITVFGNFSQGQKVATLATVGFVTAGLPMLAMLGYLVQGIGVLLPSGAAMSALFTRAGPILTRFGGYVMTAARYVGGLGAALFRLGAAWLVGLGPLGWGIIALTAVAGAVIYAYNRFEWFRTGVHSVLAWFKGAWQSAADWVPQAWEGTLAWFDTLPERMMNLGGEMMAGLKLGIQNRIGEVKASITGLGDEMMGSFKSLLGIQSPSKVFMGYGRMIPAGLEKGIQKGLGESVLAPQLSAALPNPVTNREGGRSGGSVGAITINVNASQRPEETARAVRNELTDLFSSLGLELGVSA